MRGYTDSTKIDSYRIGGGDLLNRPDIGNPDKANADNITGGHMIYTTAAAQSSQEHSQPDQQLFHSTKF